jgi:hypothetical protein
MVSLFFQKLYKNAKGGVRLDDNGTRIFGSWRADVTGAGAWEPPSRN